MERGTCKLCEKDKELCDSHYLPAAGYRYSRAKALKNPNPVMLMGESPRQGTLQVRDYVFCQECEGRLNLNGERWLSTVIPHDYGAPFPLRDALLKSPPATSEPGRVRVPARGVAGVEDEKLLYFASSVFWRGSAHKWPPVGGSEIPKIDLGNHEAALKLYLRHEQPFPSEVWLTVMLWPFQRVPPGLVFPDEYPMAEWERYWFYVSGLGFVLDVGDKVPEEVRKFSTSQSLERLITVDERFGAMAWNRMKALFGDLSKFTDLLNQIAEAKSIEKQHNVDPGDIPTK